MHYGCIADVLNPNHDADFLILAPHLAGLSPEVADLAGPLPIGGANAAVLEALSDARREIPPPLYAGVLTVDPFLGGQALYESLARRGAAGVVNLPTVGLAAGEFKRALEEAGCGYARELEALGQARDFGLDVIALIFSYDQGAHACSLGIDNLILHPGLPSADGEVLARLAEGAEAVIDRLRGSPAPARILLYRHPAFGTLLDAPARQADGVVDWRVSA